MFSLHLTVNITSKKDTLLLSNSQQNKNCTFPPFNTRIFFPNTIEGRNDGTQVVDNLIACSR